MLDQVSFKAFKSLREVTLDLEPFTVLVGPNGSGKSSVLHGLYLLSRTGVRIPDAKRFEVIFGGASSPDRLASEAAPVTVELAARQAGADTLSLSIDIAGTSGSRPRTTYRVVVDGPQGRRHEASIPRHGLIPFVEDEETPLDHPRIRRFSSVAHLRLDASVMVRTSTTDEERPRVHRDGSGLASTLAWLAGAKPDRLHDIAATLSTIVPGVRRILVHRERIVDSVMDKVTLDGQPVWRPVERARLGDRFSIEFDDGPEVPADLLSEGTVLALGLLTKLHEPERPRVLLLDDIDRGLHIGAQARLVGTLRELMRQDPELQIVCTTHSAYLLDMFEPAEVRVLDIDPTRTTHAQPLTDHPDFEDWRFGSQTGELWASLGEGWVA